MVRAGCPWRLMPTNLPPLEGGSRADAALDSCRVSEAAAHDLRVLLRVVPEERMHATVEGCLSAHA